MSTSILVVDDNTALGENVAEILESEGFEAISVDSPSRALEAASMRVFDCLVLDVRMPEMDGIELGSRLLQVQPNAALIFMTAFGDDDRREAARLLGAQAFLSKPFGARALISLLRGPAAS